MAQTRQNKIVTITNDETYDLATHQARLADSANVVIPVANQAARDALVKYAGMAVARLDLSNQQIEVWNGTTWQRNDETGSVITSDANWGFNGGLIRQRGVARTHVHLSLRMDRIGGSFSLPASFTVLGNFIPAGWYPSIGASGIINLFTSGSVLKTTLAIVISGTGDFLLQPISGTSTVATGDYFVIDVGWHANLSA